MQYCDLGWRVYLGIRDRERTIAALRNEIVDRRDREYNAEFDDPGLDWLRDDPEFVEIMRALQDDLAKQRAWVTEKECAGEMPPAPGVETTIDCG